MINRTATRRNTESRFRINRNFCFYTNKYRSLNENFSETLQVRAKGKYQQFRAHKKSKSTRFDLN